MKFFKLLRPRLPMIAGSVAMLSAVPAVTPAEAQVVACPPGYGYSYGYGCVPAAPAYSAIYGAPVVAVAPVYDTFGLAYGHGRPHGHPHHDFHHDDHHR